MTDDTGPKTTDIVPSEPPRPPATVPLGPTPALDLSGLSDEQRVALISDYAKGRIQIAHRAEELGVEVRALEETLKTLADTTQDISETGNAVTITHTQTTSVGRTEIIMGNTDQAAKGRLSRSQTGDRDWTPMYVGGALITALLIAIAVAGR